MSAINGIIYKCRRGFLTLILLFVSFLLIVLNDKSGVVSLSKVGFSIIYPFEYMFNSVGSSANSVVNAVGEMKKIEEQLEMAKKELDQYRKLMVDFNVIIKENDELRNVLNLKNSLAYKTVTAKIIARDPNSLYDYIVIDKGSNAGISENMPVISYKNGRKALVGKVYAVTPFASKVITLKNPDLKVGVVIDYDGTYCMVQGDKSTLDFARLLYVPKNFLLDSSKSNMVYTSGDSIFYPKGIEIGVISEITESKRYEVFNEAKVKITEDYSKLEFVLVLVVNSKKDDYKMMENPF